jgi:hypothetical protein
MRIEELVITLTWKNWKRHLQTSPDSFSKVSQPSPKPTLSQSLSSPMRPSPRQWGGCYVRAALSRIYARQTFCCWIGRRRTPLDQRHLHSGAQAHVCTGSQAQAEGRGGSSGLALMRRVSARMEDREGSCELDHLENCLPAMGEL